MEYALLIDSYRVDTSTKSLLCWDNLVYFLGAALFVIPLTRFSFYFGLFTVFFYCLVFVFLNLFDANLIKLLFTRKEELTKVEVEIAIDFRRLGLDFIFKSKAFSFNLFFYVFSLGAIGRFPGSSSPLGP